MVKKLSSLLLIFIITQLSSLSSLQAYLVSLDIFEDPMRCTKIYILGDIHQNNYLLEEKAQLEAFTSMLTKLTNRKDSSEKPLLLLIEDTYETLGTQKDEKEVRMQTKTLPGLVAYTKSLNLKSTTIQNVDLEKVTARAFYFFNWRQIPPFWGKDPMLNNKQISYYSLTFEDLFNELSQLIAKIKNLKKEMKTELLQDIFEYELSKISIALDNLSKTLTTHHLFNPKMSMLLFAIKLFFEDIKKISSSKEFSEYVQALYNDVILFAEKYPKFKSEEWAKITKDLKNRIFHMLEKNDALHFGSEETREICYKIYSHIYTINCTLNDLYTLHLIDSNISKASEIFIVVGRAHAYNIGKILTQIGFLNIAKTEYSFYEKPLLPQKLLAIAN